MCTIKTLGSSCASKLVPKDRQSTARAQSEVFLYIRGARDPCTVHSSLKLTRYVTLQELNVCAQCNEVSCTEGKCTVQWFTHGVQWPCSTSECACPSFFSVPLHSIIHDNVTVITATVIIVLHCTCYSIVLHCTCYGIVLHCTCYSIVLHCTWYSTVLHCTCYTTVLHCIWYLYVLSVCITLHTL